MSYRIYRTRATVLRSFPYREADRTLALYTEDFGLIYARAQGVRLEKSRLRYAVCDLSIANVSLVRGKAGWRLTGAIAQNISRLDRESLVSYARIAALVSRLVGGEEPNSYLFDTLMQAHTLLSAKSDPELVEVVSVSRILHSLGYVATESSDKDIFDTEYTIDALESARPSMPRLVSRINEALIATQL